MAALSPGTRLGTYEVVEPIGKGGMGEVYRARDTTLGRDVAIKVLPEDFSADAERLARFRREAQVLASLNHPNIAAIYGTEQNALILELVEGPTLAERIAEGPIPLEEAIAIARQIAEALEAAHEAGVIHRDLKPPNVKVQEDGTVKLLDFGLAKAIEGETEGDSSESPTLTGAATRAGVIMGTAAYMSPEQAKGKKVDKRADVWAFGAVLYEMLTGKRAFVGDDISDTLAAVLRAEPDWQALPVDLSPTLGAYLTRCLEKDPKLRVRDIGDVRLALDGAFEMGAPPSSTGAERRVGWAAIGAALVLGSAVTVIAIWGWLRPAAGINEGEAIHLEIGLPAGQEFVDDIAISPAGDQVAYVAKENDGPAQLYLRSLDTFEARLVTGSEGATYPFFSPDGESVGFASGGQLHRVAVAGGAPVPITEAPIFMGGSWGPDDSIVFALFGVGLLRVPAIGGTPETLVVADDSTIGYAPTFPQFMPDGENVLFTSWKNNRAQIGVVSIATGVWKIVFPDGPGAHFIESGHLLFSPGESESRPSELRAVPFDPERLEVTGGPVGVLEDVTYSSNTNGVFAVSSSGTLAYVRSSRRNNLVWVDREGAERVLAADQGWYEDPAISPDASRVALKDFTDIWVLDIERDTRARLSPGGDNRSPVWTLDGTQIVFASNRGGNWDIYSRPAGGGGELERLLEMDGMQAPMSWSRDGNVLAFCDAEQDIWMLPLEGEPKPFLSTPYKETSGRFSSDGRFLAYVSDESGQDEVYVVPYPVPDSRHTISTDGGTEPVWAHSGEELFYRRGEELIAVELKTDQGFSVGASRTLFRGTYLSASTTVSPNRAQYDVAPDDQSFLMVRRDAGSIPTRINVVTNFFEELKERVGN